MNWPSFVAGIGVMLFIEVAYGCIALAIVKRRGAYPMKRNATTLPVGHTFVAEPHCAFNFTVEGIPADRRCSMKRLSEDEWSVEVGAIPPYRSEA